MKIRMYSCVGVKVSGFCIRALGGGGMDARLSVSN
jgi:hypothetical protein